MAVPSTIVKHCAYRSVRHPDGWTRILDIAYVDPARPTVLIRDRYVWLPRPLKFIRMNLVV